MPQKTIADTLKLLIESRLHKGKPMSANELARQTGVPQSTITRILTGKVKDPRTKQVQAIARFFNLSVAQLRGEEPLMAGDHVERPMMSVAVVNNEPKEEMSLVYVSMRELTILTAFRSSNEIGQAAMEAALNALAAAHPRAVATVRKLRS